MKAMKAPQLFAAIACVAALALSVVQALRWQHLRMMNAAMADYAAGHDAAPPRDAFPILRAARGLMLLKQNRVDDAQAEFDSIDPDSQDPARTTLLYALANAHLRRALDLFNSEPMRKVAPLIGLAQSEYRQVLRRDPDNWDARTNFDIASALTHDPGVAAYLKGNDMARERALVPDAPGAPNGLP
jgi:mxaK protein